MKILYVTTISGTINSFLVPHIKLLLEQGHKVDAACSRAGELSRELLELGVRAYNIEFSRSPLKPKNLAAYKRIKELLEKGRYDLVHVHTPVASFVTRLAARNLANIKVIYTAHGFHFYIGAPILSSLAYRTLERLAARWTDGIITINDEDYRAAQRFKLRRGGCVHYIPGVGIEPDRFRPLGPDERKKLRQRLGFSEDDFVMLFAAELNRNKHQDLLIRVVKQLKDKGIRTILLLAGRDTVKGKYMKLADELGLGKDVFFLGERDDIDALLRAADVALSSSRREGLPVNIMEAMAAGLPVVATYCRGNRDLVRDGQNGFLVRADDAAGFARSIEHIYKSKELRQTFGRNGRTLVNAYTLDKVLSCLNGIYTLYLKPKDERTYVISSDMAISNLS
ncbi:MAG TPA: glycosyltransferase family 4 protein [Candidatus Atribacteria bacterium]|nr:glycosyltransferase family 4 protein [Candidatus Atribacteria bacterium]